MIKIIGRLKHKSKLYFCDYNPLLDKAINNFKTAKTVKVIDNVVYIEFCSLSCFVEILLNENVKFQIITTLN
jgi:hypothetical protein